MSRRFFDQIDDELRGMLGGPGLTGFSSQRNARLIKVWFGQPWMHFEAQMVSSRWAPRGRPVIDVGLHLESPAREQNQEVLDHLISSRARWSKALSGAEAAKALGPQAATWRRLSELIDAGDPEDSDLAGEVAERLAVFVKTLRPMVQPFEESTRV